MRSIHLPRTLHAVRIPSPDVFSGMSEPQRPPPPRAWTIQVVVPHQRSMARLLPLVTAPRSLTGLLILFPLGSIALSPRRHCCLERKTTCHYPGLDPRRTAVDRAPLVSRTLAWADAHRRRHTGTREHHLCGCLPALRLQIHRPCLHRHHRHHLRVRSRCIRHMTL